MIRTSHYRLFGFCKWLCNADNVILAHLEQEVLSKQEYKTLFYFRYLNPDDNFIISKFIAFLCINNVLMIQENLTKFNHADLG